MLDSQHINIGGVVMLSNSKAFKEESVQKINKLKENLLKPIILKKLLEEGIINSSTYMNALKEKNNEG